MGQGMAKNILEAGYPLTIMGHRNRAPVEDLVERGATEAQSAKAVAEASDIVVLCVTSSEQVVSIVEGDDGLSAAGKPITIVDCSTSDPSVTRPLAERMAARDIVLLDAPLSRTPKDAWEGTLDVMIGGPDDDVARVRPIVDTFAGRVVHTGPVGTGHTMKLLNNFLSLGYGAIYAEALMLAAGSGLKAETFHEVVSDGRMDCGFYQTFMKYVVGGDREAHKFTLRNALKDTTYLNAFAQSQGATNPIAAAVRNSYAQAVGGGHGDDFVPMLTDIIAQANGVR